MINARPGGYEGTRGNEMEIIDLTNLSAEEVREKMRERINGNYQVTDNSFGNPTYALFEQRKIVDCVAFVYNQLFVNPFK